MLMKKEISVSNFQEPNHYPENVTIKSVFKYLPCPNLIPWQVASREEINFLTLQKLLTLQSEKASTGKLKISP